jgi:peptidoglycan glycosyltransferase
MTAEHASELQQMMAEWVSNGTGHNAQIPGVEVAARLGRRNRIPSASRSHGSHPLRPLTIPQVAVAVIIEDADIPRSDIAGWAAGSTDCQAVMQAAL